MQNVLTAERDGLVAALIAEPGSTLQAAEMQPRCSRDRRCRPYSTATRDTRVHLSPHAPQLSPRVTRRNSLHFLPRVQADEPILKFAPAEA